MSNSGRGSPMESTSVIILKSIHCLRKRRRKKVILFLALVAILFNGAKVFLFLALVAILFNEAERFEPF